MFILSWKCFNENALLRTLFCVDQWRKTNVVFQISNCMREWIFQIQESIWFCISKKSLSSNTFRAWSRDMSTIRKWFKIVSKLNQIQINFVEFDFSNASDLEFVSQQFFSRKIATIFNSSFRVWQFRRSWIQCQSEKDRQWKRLSIELARSRHSQS